MGGDTGKAGGKPGRLHGHTFMPRSVKNSGIPLYLAFSHTEQSFDNSTAVDRVYFGKWNSTGLTGHVHTKESDIKRRDLVLGNCYGAEWNGRL